MIFVALKYIYIFDCNTVLLLHECEILFSEFVDDIHDDCRISRSNYEQQAFTA